MPHNNKTEQWGTMKMPTIAPVDTQGLLFEVPMDISCTSNGSAQNAYGTAAQEIAYSALGITPIRINGSFDACFDGFRDGCYYEIKSTKQKSGKIVVYDCRMEKEVATGVDLLYVIVCHNLSEARADILTRMANQGVSLYLLPADVLHRQAKLCPLRTLGESKIAEKRKDSRNGYVRAGYADGYRNLPLSALVESCRWDSARVLNQYGDGLITLYTYRGSRVRSSAESIQWAEVMAYQEVTS